MAEKLKDRFKVGQRVRFRRSHDQATVLTGEIVKIHPGADDVLDVESEVDGKIVEVSRVETVHARDVTAIVEKPAPAAKKGDDSKKDENKK